MKKIVFFVLVLCLLFAMGACKELSVSDFKTVIVSGCDCSSYGIEDMSLVWQEYKSEDAPKEKTVAFGGKDYTGEYKRSYFDGYVGEHYDIYGEGYSDGFWVNAKTGEWAFIEIEVSDKKERTPISDEALDEILYTLADTYIDRGAYKEDRGDGHIAFRKYLEDVCTNEYFSIGFEEDGEINSITRRGIGTFPADLADASAAQHERIRLLLSDEAKNRAIEKARSASNKPEKLAACEIDEEGTQWMMQKDGTIGIVYRVQLSYTEGGHHEFEVLVG